MKAKLLKTKIPVVIRPIVPWTCFPACARPEHLPNKKKRFDAEVRALWYIGLSIYAAIVVEGRRLVVPIGFLENPYKVNDIIDNAEENFLRTPSDIGRYGKEDFAEDLLLSEADECRLICCGRFEEDRCIRYFSRAFRVRPGILVERLQQQGKLPRRTLLNDFKVAV